MFEAISGLKVNLPKSRMMGVGEVQNLLPLVEILKCQVASLPSLYLGLPIGENHQRRSLWDPVVEKSEQRLVGWKGRHLSKGGKLTLIKSVLANLPVYSFLSSKGGHEDQTLTFVDSSVLFNNHLPS